MSRTTLFLPSHLICRRAGARVTFLQPQGEPRGSGRKWVEGVAVADEKRVCRVEYMSYRAKMIAILGSISGLLSILLVGWTVFRCCQRKRKAMARKRESSFGSRRLFPPLSRAAGWRDLPPHRDGHYPDDDHSVDGPSGAAPHQPIYGNEVFEMSKDFNRCKFPRSYTHKRPERVNTHRKKKKKTPYSCSRLTTRNQPTTIYHSHLLNNKNMKMKTTATWPAVHPPLPTPLRIPSLRSQTKKFTLYPLPSQKKNPHCSYNRFTHSWDTSRPAHPSLLFSFPLTLFVALLNSPLPFHPRQICSVSVPCTFFLIGITKNHILA